MQGYKSFLILGTFAKPTATVWSRHEGQIQSKIARNITTYGYFLTYLNMWGMLLLTNQLHNACFFPSPPQRVIFSWLVYRQHRIFYDEVIWAFQLSVFVAVFGTFDWDSYEFV